MAENLYPLTRHIAPVPFANVVKANVFVVAANRLLRDLLGNLVAASSDLSLAGSDGVANSTAAELRDAGGKTVVLLWVPEISVPKQLLDHIETVRSTSPGLRLMLLGMPADEQIFLATVHAGIAGYILDDAPMEEVIDAVHRVAQGEVVCPSQLLPALFRWVASQPYGVLAPAVSNRFGLSRREWQLVPLIAQGMTNKEIASKLCLSEQTVKNHLRRMMRKAGADNRFAVVERCGMANAASM